jgi:hypothetical protein
MRIKSNVRIARHNFNIDRCDLLWLVCEENAGIRRNALGLVDPGYGMLAKTGRSARPRLDERKSFAQTVGSAWHPQHSGSQPLYPARTYPPERAYA